MTATFTAIAKDEHLLLEASGCIADLEAYKQFATQCYDEIVHFGKTKIIIDIDKLKAPKSLLILNDLLEFLSARLPEEIRYWTIAFVTTNRGMAIGKYWEFLSNQSGYRRYKAFASIEEAQIYIEDPDRHS